MPDISRPIVCEHIQPLVDHLLACGEKITYAGQAWSTNCRTWVYFDCILPFDDLRRLFPLAPCLEYHENTDSHSGQESGLVCNEHHDAIVGRYIERSSK